MSRQSGSRGASASRREQLRLQQEAEARRRRTMRIVTIAAAVLAVALMALVGTLWYNSRSKPEPATTTAQVVPPHANADRTGITVNPGRAKPGVPSVVVYQDYQCPTCKAVEDVTGEWMNDLAAKGEVALEYRTMTFLDVSAGNDASTRAAVAAACADTVGAYPKYHDTVYRNQPEKEGTGYTDDQLRSVFVGQAGISGTALTTFQGCYDGRATLDFVRGTDQKASEAKVTGTPTYRVNGHEMDWKTMLGLTSEQQLRQLITTTAG